MNEVLIPVSIGELIDKITILQIKLEQITDQGRLANVMREINCLSEIATGLGLDCCSKERLELREINLSIWRAEEGLRAYEAAENCGTEFVTLARRVVSENDRRAAVKKRINIAMGSTIVEEKSY